MRNCTKCHSDNDVATNNTAVTGAPGWVSKVPQADNWKNNPSRLACGACHDGVNYNTGTAITLNGLMTVHGGGVQADDSMCATCHTAAVITTYHQPVSPIDPTFATNSHTNSSYIAGYNSTNLPSGALKISYDLNSVTLNASRNPVLRFRFMNNSVSPAVPVVFNDNSGVNPPLPSQSTSTTIVGIELMPNFVGGPNAYVMAAVPQDGTTPADFNASASAYIRNCWNKINAATTCTMTADGTTGYYILTMTGTVMPTNAAMIYGGIGFNDGGSTTSMPLTQSNATLDAADIPGYTALTVTTNASGFATGWKGGLNVPATPVTKLVTCGTATSTKACAPTASTPVLLTGFTAAQTTAATTARRQIVEKARCDNCHNSLGTFTFASFHGGQRNDPDRCVLCHDANRTNNGWQIASNAHVHAIHSAYKRTADNGPLFTWTATDAAGLSVGAPVNGFFEIGYPGILRNCQQCHLPNTVNFGNTANAAAANNGTMAFKTACSGTMTAGTTMSPYVTAGQNCGTGFSTSLATGATTQAAGATLVNSPIANACFSCHTLPTAMSHMRANGGSLYAPRWVVAGRVSAADFDLAASGVAGGLPLPNAEQCPVCHGQGRVADAELIHAQTMKPVYNPQ